MNLINILLAILAILAVPLLSGLRKKRSVVRNEIEAKTKTEPEVKIEKPKEPIHVQDSREIFFLNAIIDNVLLFFSYEAKDRGVTLTFNNTELVTMEQNPFQFQKIISCLVSNAINSYEDSLLPVEERTVSIRMEVIGNAIKIEVEDKGKGIDVRLLPSIFGHNEESGLSAAKRLVEQNFQGTIDFRTHTGKGTRFIILFPFNK